MSSGEHRTHCIFRMRFVRPAAVLVLIAVLGGCTRNLRRIQDPPRAIAFPTAGPWSSMVYLAQTDSGVVVIDLGWTGARGKLRRALGRMGVRPDQVRTVFLTHSHRDHIAGWRELPNATFHLSAAEVPLFEGAAHHRDVPSRVAERLWGNAGPWPGEVRVEPFSRDTAFAFGRDTVRAFLAPGHTAGSTAYLFRGVLFGGDAIRYARFFGLHAAARIFTADEEQDRASVAALWERVRPFHPRWVCTAHAKCLPADSALMAKPPR
jgi:glyoxylase-like metal-dependent hydrolase (beta-lactamase superfamily II)